MPGVWYYERNGQKSGPVSADELRQMVAAGQLQPSDQVWRDGMPRWVAASAVGQLLAPPPPSVTGEIKAAEDGSPLSGIVAKVSGAVRAQLFAGEPAASQDGQAREQRVKVKAIAGAVALVAGLALAFGLVLLLNLAAHGGRRRVWEGPLCTLAILYNGVVLAGAWQMLRLGHHSLARAAAVLVMGSGVWMFFTPEPLWWVVTFALVELVIGAAALVTLAQPEVKALFHGQPGRPATAPPLWQSLRGQPKIALVLGGLAALLLLLNVVAFLHPPVPEPTPATPPVVRDQGPPEDDPDAEDEKRARGDERLYGKWEPIEGSAGRTAIQFYEGGLVQVWLDDPSRILTGRFVFIDRATIRTRQRGVKGAWEQVRIGFPRPDELVLRGLGDVAGSRWVSDARLRRLR